MSSQISWLILSSKRRNVNRRTVYIQNADNIVQQDAWGSSFLMFTKVVRLTLTEWEILNILSTIVLFDLNTNFGILMYLP